MAAETEDIEMETNSGENDEDNVDVEEEGGIHIDDIYIPPGPPPACTFDSSGPRLMISHIVNENFKSYAGKTILGPFHKCFSSIVGPNGSGKSNVIDSMLFVFGYRAQKIRSKKISVLIHSSSQFPNVQSCTVEVHFQKIIDKDGDDEYDIVPGSKFVVSRTAFRDNSSYYQLDGKRTHFKVIGKVLRDAGIDLDHNRFLILQGEVEQISLMKPKAESEHDTGMLEFLEDVIGSWRFKEPIEKLNVKIEELNEQRTEKLNRVKLVEKEKDELEGPKDEALQYLRMENEVITNSHKLKQCYIMGCNNKIVEAEAKKKEIDDGMAELKEKLKVLTEKKQERTEKMDARSKEYEAVIKEKEAKAEEFKGYETEDHRVIEEMQHDNQNRKKMQTALKNEIEKVETYKKAPAENEGKIEELKQHEEKLLEDRKKEEEQIRVLMEGMKGETQELQDQKEVVEKELIGLKKAVNEAKAKRDVCTSELEVYISTEANEKEKFDKLKKGYETSVTTLKERKLQVKDLEKEIPVSEKAVEDARKEIERCAGQDGQLTTKIQEARGKLEEKRSAMQASSGRGEVLTSIMQQKNNGNIPGIYGRLGDLGAIEDKYDVAISTACGPLDNILVDTVETAQKCIEFLKRHSNGRGTFLALDKQDKFKQDCKRKINTPDGVPRLFDLISTEDKFRPAFYYGLRDTLVANNLEQATKIAYGTTRYRTVSLQGDMIELTGTMSGGGKRVSRGRMGSRVVGSVVRPEEVDKLQEQLVQMTEQASELRRRRAECEEVVSGNTRKLQRMKVDIKKFKLEITSLEEHFSTVEAQIKEQSVVVKSSAPDPKKVKELEATVQATTTDYEVAKQSSDKVDKKVKEIHSKIMEITGGRMTAAQKKLKDTNKKIEKTSSEITRLTVASKTAKRNLKKSEDAVERLEGELSEVKEKLTTMSGRQKEIEAKATELIKNVEDLEAQAKEMKEVLLRTKAKMDKLTEEENTLKAEKIEIDQQIGKYDLIIKENKSRINQWKREMKKLELGSIEGEEVGELVELTEEEIAEINIEEFRLKLTVLEEQLSGRKTNLNAIHEYRKKEELYLQRVEDLNAVTKKRDYIRKTTDDLRKQRLNDFMSGFTIITTKLKELYQMITLGGDAELELVDSLDPFSDGIVFSVRPPKKSWKNISNLSGGEKTLSSLALVFALHYFRTTPFYVLDEIDAALDFRNVSIVGNYVKERTKNAQFIIISLRTQMFELADRLVGIYKTYNATKTVVIDPKKIAELAKEKEEAEKGALVPSPPKASQSHPLPTGITADSPQR